MCSCVVRMAKTLFAAITMVLMRFWCDVLTFPRHPSCHICPPPWGSCSLWPPPWASPWPWVYQTVSQEAWCRRCSVLVTCNILVSAPHSTLHWVRTGGWLLAPSLRVRETELSEGRVWSVLLRPRALLLTLRGTFHWISAPLGDIITVPGYIHATRGRSLMWRYLYLKIRPLIVLIVSVEKEYYTWIIGAGI